MAAIYVDPTAATNGSGTIGSPRNIWPTGIGAGDIIYLKRGTRLTVSAQISMGAGSNNLVTSYGDAGLPRPIITSTATTQGLISVNVAGVTTFKDLHFDQCLNMGANGGVIATGAVAAARHANLSIQDCKFSGTGVNAILLNGTTTANVSSTFECLRCEFTDIGADCVFGGALDYVFAYNTCKKISTRSTNGDGVGFINADPDRVWIHHNYIDHSDVDCKQCIIVDTTTPGTGVCIIEDNILIGYGNKSTTPVLHTVIISDPVTTIRRNVIYTFGLTCGIKWAGDRITDNLFLVGNCSGQVTSITADGVCRNNTYIALNTLADTRAAIVMGTGATSAASIVNNLFVGMPRGIQSNIVGVNPTVSNNAYWLVTTPRTGSAGDFTEATEVTANPQLTLYYRPKETSPLVGAGIFLGYHRDLDGTTRQNPPSIGAYEYIPVRGTR